MTMIEIALLVQAASLTAFIAATALAWRHLLRLLRGIEDDLRCLRGLGKIAARRRIEATAELARASSGIAAVQRGVQHLPEAIAREIRASGRV